jgi:hypothetical protein
MPGKRLVRTAVWMGLLAATGCCSMADRWCPNRQPVVCAPAACAPAPAPSCCVPCCPAPTAGYAAPPAPAAGTWCAPR